MLQQNLKEGRPSHVIGLGWRCSGRNDGVSCLYFAKRSPLSLSAVLVGCPCRLSLSAVLGNLELSTPSSRVNSKQYFCYALQYRLSNTAVAATSSLLTRRISIASICSIFSQQFSLRTSSSNYKPLSELDRTWTAESLQRCGYLERQ